ncbi:MAG TPA: hypothetical protein VMH27_15805 [Puia sp.]|nr:hypothetical protein [Puia sp.]
MKKKSLSELLKRLENTQSQERLEISNLNDQLAKKMLKGGYDTSNGICGGSNFSCENESCRGTNNTSCYNHICQE